MTCFLDLIASDLISHSFVASPCQCHFEVNHEYAVTPADVLARRTRLAFLNSTAARLCLPRVVEIMADAWF